MTAPVLRRVVGARYGSVVLPLSLEYRASDPVAIALTVGSCSHRLTWHVARSVIAIGLTAPVSGDRAAWAGDVLPSRLPGSDLLVIGLRRRPHRWLIAASAAEFGAFLAATYQACPAEQEALAVAKELDMQIGFFNLAQGGNPA